MAAGRCAGCGQTGKSREVDIHIVRCPEWAELYRTSPEKALSAEEEQARWLEEDRVSDHQARIAGLREVTDGRRAAMAARFARKDPLEDE